VEQFELGWLAGLFDGEGSVGIQLNTGAKSMRPSLQMSMTCERTIRHAGNLCLKAGVRAAGYTYQEKKPEKHRDAVYLRIIRLRDILVLSEALLPYAITKRDHWSLMIDFCRLRLEGTTLNEDGQVVRGGNKKWWKPYTEREWEIYRELKELNRRGPTARSRKTTSEYGPLGAQGEAAQ
jgi:LAGLIDADG-like domain